MGVSVQMEAEGRGPARPWDRTGWARPGLRATLHSRHLAIPFSRGSSEPRDPTLVSCTADRFSYYLSHQGSPVQRKRGISARKANHLRPVALTWARWLCFGFKEKYLQGSVAPVWGEAFDMAWTPFHQRFRVSWDRVFQIDLTWKELPVWLF